MRSHFVRLVLLAASLASAQAAVTPNSLFSDDMVLQRGQPAPIWGTADKGEKVTVSFAGQSVSTTAGEDGTWRVKLQSLTASSDPADLTIQGSNTVTIKSVLVGDVWLCSGQSNMERQLGPRPPQQPLDNWEQDAAAANYPLIREFSVPVKELSAPITDVNGKWVVCSPQTAPQFSAVSFYFARALQPKVNVPIGLLFSSKGGTPAEKWTSHEAIAAQPELAKVLDDYTKETADYTTKLADYQAHEADLMKQYEADLAKAKAENKPEPKKPAPPRKPNEPACLYNAMIAPLIPFPIKGTIWYQGESNSGSYLRYRTLFPTMIADWRQRWGIGDFPFLFVQIAPYRSNTPGLREAQLFTLKASPNTAMVVTTDIGDAADIHPPHKAPVGERLALAARALAYGEKIEYSGPIFDSAKIDGGKAVVSFTHVGDGLEAKDGPLKGFELAGADKKFVAADAQITGNTVTVSSAQVPQPMFVRFGWSNTPDVNLFGKNGLPASPFRTDTE